MLLLNNNLFMRTAGAISEILHVIFSVLFYLLTLFFGFVLVLEGFTDDGAVGNFSSNFHSSRGYTLPVEFKIEPKAPMLDNYIHREYKEVIDDKGNKTYIKEPQYGIPVSSSDSLNYKTVVASMSYTSNNYDIISNTFYGKGQVYVKPNTIFKRTVIILRTYLNLILLIVTFFLLKNIFKWLKKRIEFSQRLYRLIQSLGFVILSGVLLTVISNYILGIAFSDTIINPINYNFHYVEITMSSYLGIDYSLILIGLSLIVLASLLKKGSRIEYDSKLTI